MSEIGVSADHTSRLVFPKSLLKREEGSITCQIYDHCLKRRSPWTSGFLRCIRPIYAPYEHYMTDRDTFP